MNCAIVTIGTELLLGQITDTNASYLAQELNRIGLPVALHTSVGDDYTQIKDALSEALKRADLVITTGGLGPTEDDLTREVIADDDTLHGVVINLLNKRRKTLGIVETFTGGMLTARLCSSLPSPVRESIVIGSREQVFSFLNTKRRVIDGKAGEALATKIRTVGNSSIGLALLGSIKAIEKAYEVYAHVIVSGRDVNGSYEWKMGGDIPTLQSRGATIALNTLRLALIS